MTRMKFEYSKFQMLLYIESEYSYGTHGADMKGDSFL